MSKFVGQDGERGFNGKGARQSITNGPSQLGETSFQNLFPRMEQAKPESLKNMSFDASMSSYASQDQPREKNERSGDMTGTSEPDECLDTDRVPGKHGNKGKVGQISGKMPGMREVDPSGVDVHDGQGGVRQKVSSMTPNTNQNRQDNNVENISLMEKADSNLFRIARSKASPRSKFSNINNASAVALLDDHGRISKSEGGADISQTVTGSDAAKPHSSRFSAFGLRPPKQSKTNNVRQKSTTFSRSKLFFRGAGGRSEQSGMGITRFFNHITSPNNNAAKNRPSSSNSEDLVVKDEIFREKQRADRLQGIKPPKVSEDARFMLAAGKLDTSKGPDLKISKRKYRIRGDRFKRKIKNDADLEEEFDPTELTNFFQGAVNADDHDASSIFSDTLRDSISVIDNKSITNEIQNLSNVEVVGVPPNTFRKAELPGRNRKGSTLVRKPAIRPLEVAPPDSDSENLDGISVDEIIGLNDQQQNNIEPGENLKLIASGLLGYVAKLNALEEPGGNELRHRNYSETFETCQVETQVIPNAKPDEVKEQEKSFKGYDAGTDKRPNFQKETLLYRPDVVLQGLSRKTEKLHFAERWGRQLSRCSEFLTKICPVVSSHETYIAMRKQIGEGSFGIVYQCRDVKSNIIMAVKVCEARKQHQVIDLGKEINFMRIVRHCPNVVRFYHCFQLQWSKKIFIMMELCEAGDLSNIMEETDKGFTEAEILPIVASVLLALEFLHSHNIIHRDVKCGNLMVGVSGLTKLGDFGVSRLVKDHKPRAMTNTGSPYWMAPEMYTDGVVYNNKVDLWALGITIYELFYKLPPFFERDMDEIADIVCDPANNSYYSLPANNRNVSFKMEMLTDDLTCFLPDKRASAESALKARAVSKTVRQLKKLIALEYFSVAKEQNPFTIQYGHADGVNDSYAANLAEKTVGPLRRVLLSRMKEIEAKNR